MMISDKLSHRAEMAISALLFLILSTTSFATEKKKPDFWIEGMAIATVKERTQGALVIGFKTESMSLLKLFSTSISDAAIAEFESCAGVLVGQQLSQALAIVPEEQITLVHPTGETTVLGTNPLVKRYRVLGIVDGPFVAANNETVYVCRTDAEKFAM